MRKKRLHNTSIVLGSILALAIAFSQYLTPLPIASETKAKTEQSGKADAEKTLAISLPSFSLPAPVNIQVNLDAYCLFEICFEENVDEDYVEDDLSYIDRIFHTMFRVIISPNAP